MSLWHVLESRAITAGIWGVPGAPRRLLNVDSTIFLAFVEGVLREDEENNEGLSELYEQAAPKPPQSREDRRASIERFARITGGAV